MFCPFATMSAKSLLMFIFIVSPIDGPGDMYWALDILNWTPWLKINPYSNPSGPGAETGELMITSSPASPAVMAQIGYTPPSTTRHYTTGYMRNSSEFGQQYGFYECCMKSPGTQGSWPAFWLQAQDGRWPPEIDIVENYGVHPGLTSCTIHSNPDPIPVFTDTSQFDYGDMVVDNTSEYSLYACELTPTSVDFYVNRELICSYPTSFDFHTLWYMQFDIFTAATAGVPDLVTPQPLHIGYAAAWKRTPQNPTIPTGTQAETTALLAAMNVQPNQTRINLINTLIASLKSYTTSLNPSMSLWQALDFLYLEAAHDKQAARINWKNPSQAGTEVGNPVFVTDRGYTGALNTSYIDTGINLSTAGFQLTNTLSHIGGCVVQSTTANGNIIGTPNFFITENSNGTTVSNNFSATTYTKTINGQSGHPNTPTNPSSGRSLVTRYQFHFTFYYDGKPFTQQALGTNSTVSLDNTICSSPMGQLKWRARTVGSICLRTI
jgi:Glycosyl hydrolases family 16